jgi:hypothetical protein
MTIIERAKALRTLIEKTAESLSDAESLEATELFPKWKEGSQYEVGQRVRYENRLYKVLQPHRSAIGWTPDYAASLYAKVLIPDENVIPEWEQPESTNPYMLGDKVNHKGATWESIIDNNVWEPSVYGWKEVTNET